MTQATEPRSPPDRRAQLVAGVLLLIGASGPVSGSGAEDFQALCAACHGVDGSGNGPMSARLKVPAADLTKILNRYGGRFPTEHLIDYLDGRQQPGAQDSRDMPAWGNHLSRVEELGRLKRIPEHEIRQRLAQIVDFLRSIQR